MGVASKLARKIKPRKKTTMKSPDVKENELIHRERKIAQRLMGPEEGYYARAPKRRESTKDYESRLGEMDFASDLMESGRMSASDVKEVLEIHNNLTIGDRRKNIREAVRTLKAYGEKNPGKNISKRILNNAGVEIENGKVVIKETATTYRGFKKPTTRKYTAKESEDFKKAVKRVAANKRK